MTDLHDTEAPDLDAFQASWRNENTDHFEASLMDIQKRARKYQLKSDIDFYGGLACTIIILVITAFALTVIPDGLLRLAFFVMAVGCIAVVYFYARNRSKHRQALADPPRACFESYRRLLQARIQSTRTAWVWMLLPIVPGPVLAFYAINRSLSLHAPMSTFMVAQNILLGCEIAFLAMLLGLPLYWRSQVKARTRELIALDASR